MVNSAHLGVTDLGLCLAFINTEGVERNSPPDRLENLDLFLEWAAREGVVEAERTTEISRALGRRRGVDDLLDRARVLREALYRIFSAIAADRQPPEDDLAIVDRYLEQALPGLRLGRDDGRFGWRLAAPTRPDEILLPIALSAADLLCSDRLDRVKECGGETCSWMFLDESRNRSRRWCDMSDCGNRAKARRYYRRHTQS